MSERVSDTDSRGLASSSKSPRAASEDADPSPSRAATSRHSDEDSVASAELVPGAVMVEEEEEEEGEEGEEEEDDAVAPWIRANFPSVKSERDEEALRLSSGFTTALCDECAARHATVSCVDCAQILCWRCADAIHIIPELAAHSVRLGVAAIQDDARCELSLAAPVDAVAVGAGGEQQADDTSVTASAAPPPRDDHHAFGLTVGCDVLFRAVDCGRWPRELLHGVLVSSSTTTATATDGGQRAFVRVLWLRGVQSLANGSFRASLLLPAAVSVVFSIAPTVPIGVFPSRLGALRAVAVAEALARRARRHARAAALINRHSASPVPSRAEVAQVRGDALETLDKLALALPLRLAGDKEFMEEIVSGRWDLDEWLKSKLGDDLAREWQDEGMEHLDGYNTAAEVAWPPPKQQLVRFFSLEARELSLPEHERSRQLHRVVLRLLFVYAGFAWSRWRKFVQRHRRQQRRALESQSAFTIQRWCRRRWERARSTSPMAATWSMDELEQAYRRRQGAAESLFQLLLAQWEKRMRRAIERWAAAAELTAPDVQRRIGRVQHSTRWHPSHGMSGSGGSGTTKGPSDDRGTALPPRLPRVFAHATPDGRVVVEDVARFQQFRATHAGPTAASYWLLRGRVLLGAYPSASSQAAGVGKARVGVSALRGAAGGDQRPRRADKDPVTSVLLEQVNTFVCLVATRELQELEEQLERAEALSRDDKLQTRNQTAEATTRWRFERLVRRRYDALLLELRAGEKRAARQMELALKAQSDAAELVATRQASRRASAQDVADAEQELEMAAARCELARQHDAAARAALSRLTMRLAFEHLPIRKDGGPGDGDSDSDLISPEAEARRALELVSQLEERLRAGQNLFVFSRDGRGRTGLVGALLLGRLYGLTAREALERAQRAHDCQPRYQAVSMTSSSSTVVIPASPTSARHVALVRAALAASTDAIYAPLTRENPAEAFVSSRAARRGLLAAPLLDSDGALLSDEPDEQQREQQLKALKGEQRVAAREAAGHRRAKDKRRESGERTAMTAEDDDAEEEEGVEVSATLAAMVRRVEGETWRLQ